MAEGSEREPLLGVEENGIPDHVSSSTTNISSTRIQPRDHGETTPITTFVMIILFVFVALVSPATILELTQDIRETKDQYLSDYLKFGLIALTIFVMLTLQVSYCSCRRGNGVMESAVLPIAIPRWKVIPYLLMGLPAIYSFGFMCKFAYDNASEFCMNVSRIIFITAQYVLFFIFSDLIPVRFNCYTPKSVCLHYFQIALAIASNVAICIDLIIEDDREIPPEDSLTYTYPFRLEFLLFSISMWLEFFPKYESKDEPDSVGLGGSPELFHQNKPCIASINFVWTHCMIACYVIVYLYKWLSTCSNFKNTSLNNYNHSNTTNTTSDNSKDKPVFPLINIALFTIIIFFELFLLRMIVRHKQKTPSVMHRSLKPNEVLLIVCALFFNVYQVAIIIPDIYVLANKDQATNAFTVAEVIESFIAIIYIFFQTSLILNLARLEHSHIGFNIFPYVPIYYMTIALNMTIWLLSCFEKLNACIAWESSKAYSHYWHILQSSLFPVGIFFQWHSGELLFEIGLELKLSKIYITIWCFVCQPICKCINSCRNYRQDAMTVS